MSNSIFKTPEIQQKAYIVLGLAGLLIGLQIINALSGSSLIPFGIVPRELSGLWGIIFSPFIHGSYSHLWSNLFVFIFLSSFIIWRGISEYFEISTFLIISSGALVWMFAPANTVIVGASGIIFGYIGYLLGRAFFNKNVTDILTAMAVGFLYGGMLFGIFPGDAGVSWQSHLAGFICGIFAAMLWRNKIKNRRIG